MLGRVATALISIASLRIMTHLLAPKDFGVYTLLLAFQGFCGLILINPVGQHINRHTHAWWDDSTLLKRLVGYNLYILIVAVFIAIVVMIWWLLYPSTDNHFLTSLLAALAVSAIVYFGTWNGTFIYILNMIGFRGGSVMWMTTTSIVGLVCSTILVYQFHTSMSWMIGQAVGMAIGAIGAGTMLRKHQTNKAQVHNNSNKLPTLLNRETVVKYCLPLATATGLMWLQSTGYRFWVGGVWGVAELGMLAIGLSISSQLWAVIEGLAMQFLHPYFFRHITEAKTDEQMNLILSDMVNVMWPLYAVFAGFNMLFASSLLVVLTDARYHSAVTFVMLGGLIEFARCTTNLWSYASQIQRRTTKIILPYAIGALIVWLATLGLSYFNGTLQMLAIALVISGIVTCSIMIILMQRLHPVVIDLRRWLIALSILIICIFVDIYIPIYNQDLYQNLLLLLLGAFFCACCMAIQLLRNPALTRLLSVSLRNN